MFLDARSFYVKVLKLKSAYWNEGAKYRWEYMSAVIDILKIMGAESICEAGASGIPLNDKSFLMDYPQYDLDKPLPEFDKFFDCFVALQVWEHLKNPIEAFRQVMKISRAAILSFPYKWKHGDKQHNNIDENVISKWTCGIKPVFTKLIKDRIIYVWRF